MPLGTRPMDFSYTEGAVTFSELSGNWEKANFLEQCTTSVRASENTGGVEWVWCARNWMRSEKGRCRHCKLVPWRDP